LLVTSAGLATWYFGNWKNLATGGGETTGTVSPKTYNAFSNLLNKSQTSESGQASSEDQTALPEEQELNSLDLTLPESDFSDIQNDIQGL